MTKKRETEKRIGETNISNDGTLMMIVEYKNALNVIIEFQDEYKARKNITYNNFKNGCAENPYKKNILQYRIYWTRRIYTKNS